MQQTKELNAFFIRGVCSEATVAEGVPQQHRLGQPCTAPGHPTLPASLGKARREGGTSGALEETCPHFSWEGVEEQGSKAVVSLAGAAVYDLRSQTQEITLHDEALPQPEGLMFWKVQGVSPDPAGPLQWWLFLSSK